MLKQYSWKKRKQLELYFRCLSGPCIDSILGDYYTIFEFHRSERWLRNRILKQTLQAWEIRDAESLKSKIRWLLDDGNREAYKDMHLRLSMLTEAARRKQMESSKDESDYERMVVIHNVLRQLPTGEIAGFGGGWAIFLCRVGVVYQLLTKEEAWEIKLEAARHVQKHHDSWQNYFISFAAGSQFHLSDRRWKKCIPVMNRVSTILGRSTLGWKKAAWNQDLLPDKEKRLSKEESISV